MDRIANLEHKKRVELATQYKSLISSLGLFNEKQTIYKLASRNLYVEENLSGRKFRKIAEDIMYLFIYDYLDFLIVGDKNGYFATNKQEELEAYLKKKHRQFLALSKNYYTLKKCLLNKINLSIDFEDQD